MHTPAQVGLPPVLDGGIEILLLGSFPSTASLAGGRYYAHPRNQFWRLLEDIIGEPLAGMPYDRRLHTLLAHRIGLWDLLGACRRRGSLDADIRDARHNDFAQLLRTAKKLRRVCFNGKTAARAAPVFQALGYDTLALPSSSPAYTLAYAKKLGEWRRMITAGTPDRT